MATRKKRSGTKKKRPGGASRARNVRRPAPKLVVTLRAVSGVLEQLEWPGAIIGGVAVIAWGFSRTTGDVDCSVAASLEDLDTIAQAFTKRGFSLRFRQGLQFARENHLLALRFDETGVDVDLSLGMLPFEAQALSNSDTRDFQGVQIKVPSVSDLMIYKLVAGRPQDHRDVGELLLLHDVDAERVTAQLAEFDSYLDTDRVSDWRRLWLARNS